MAIGVYFSPRSVNTQQYAAVMKQLEAEGAGSPKGRSYHSAFGPDDHLMVFEVWDSQADFDAFGKVLMPVLAKNNIDPGQPDIMPIHNVIKGSRVSGLEARNPAAMLRHIPVLFALPRPA